MSIVSRNTYDDLFAGVRELVRAALMILGFSLAIGVQVTQAQQLPGENELPGAAIQESPLPSESALPGQASSADGELPGEDQMPGVDGAGSGAQLGANASAPIDGQAPILRLAYDGHTGTVRTLDISDGGRTLVTAGEDKDVHVWRRSEISDTGWIHIRTIRWPVTRGPRGLISTARLNGDLVAFAGYGAFGARGEIRIVNAASGELIQTLYDPQEGHLSSISSLAWSPEEEPRLASVDLEGRLIVWAVDPTTGLWRGKTVVHVDEQTYNPRIAAVLKQSERRAVVPVTFVGPHRLVVPRFVGPAPNQTHLANWHLQLVDLQTGTWTLLEDVNHRTHVRSLSATADGRVLASCEFGDESAVVGVWTLGADGKATSFKKIEPQEPTLFIDLADDGKRLLVGSEHRPGSQATLEYWDIESTPPRLLSQQGMDREVRACLIDDQHREAIVSQANHIEILPINEQGKFVPQSVQRLIIPANPVFKVAFSQEPGSYKIAFGWRRNEAGEKLLEGVFDLSRSRLEGRGPIDPDDYLPAQRTAARWQVGNPIVTAEGPRYQLYEGETARSVLPLSLDRHGWPTTVCTLPAAATGTEEPGEKPKTAAVIVGTGGEFGIYAYRASDANPPELLRQFRDHSGEILSLSTSADGKYLVSTAGDATLSVWNLQEIDSLPKMVNRWGSDFEIEGNQLFATDVREDGPLYFRGVRGGDQLVLMEWTDHDAKPFAESDPARMRQRLLTLPFDQLVHFKFARLGRLGPDFQSLPAWRPLATLFIDQAREWAFWTPAGYYDASFNGHQLFGWQLNNSIDEQVEYYRAAQFRKQLERPDVMRRLLAAGSLPAAIRQTVTQIGPPPAEGAIVNQIQNKPTIRLRSPSPDQLIKGDSMTVEAEIAVPLGASLMHSKAFVSGVPAIDEQVVPNRDGADPGIVTYQWRFRLPSDSNLQLELLAATEAEAVDRVLVNLAHQPSDTPRRRPRLHILAIGASRYQDPQIQSLEFAADAVGKVSKLFQEKSSSIYQTSADQLVDHDATRPLWRVFAENVVAELSQSASPDDLVIMYLCGHGLRDRRTNQWYFVTADARYSDLMNDRYGDCIAFSDLAMLAKLPCRKLAILDSCHSGAVQPLMRRGDLKSALRFLQDDVVLTLTASEGDEEAAEQRETRLGRFTATLVEALTGAADAQGNNDRTVSLNEVIDYVSRRVAEESELEGMPQHPTASPDYLLRTLQLPLTAIE